MSEVQEMQKADGRRQKAVPEGWREVYLGDVVTDIQGGVSVNGSDYPAASNEMGVLKVGCVVDGVFNPDQNKLINRDEIEKASVSPKADSVIISRANTKELVGMCGYIEKDSPNLFLPDLLWQMRGDSRLDMRWLNLLLSSPEGRLKLSAIAAGSNASMVKINKEGLRKIQFNLPPLPEQIKIAAILSDWDDSLSTLTRLIEAKRQQKRGLAEQLLTGKRRLKGFEGEWDRQKLADYSTRTKGKIVPTNKNGIGIPYIGAKSFGGQFEDFTDDKKAVTCTPKDVLILWDGEYAGNSTTGLSGAVSSTVARLQLSEKLNGIFLQAILQKDNKVIRESRTGSGIPHMPSDFEQWYEIPLPPLPEQQAIASVLSTLDAEISSLEALKASLQQQKRGLMDVLLTGKVRVNTNDSTT